MACGYRPWFEKYPARFESESNILKEYGFTLNEAVFQNHRVVQFEGSLPVDPSRLLIVKFPGAFPSLPPLVFDTSESTLLSRHHEPNTRQLCLFGPGNARWSSGLSSLHVLSEATTVIRKFGIEQKPLEDDVLPEPISAVLDYQTGESIFVPPPVSQIEPQSSRQILGQVSLRWTPKTKTTVYPRGVIVSAVIDAKSIKVPSHYENWFDQGSQLITATLLYFPVQPAIEKLRETIFQNAKPTKSSKSRPCTWFAVLFPEQSGSVGQARIAWAFARVYADGRLEWIRGFPYRQEERMARIPSLKGIENVHVAIIGCGCLGSKIAVNLAASGVQKFTLVDPDIMEPYNSVRHEVGVTSFGIRKIDALANRLFEINPEARAGISGMAIRVGSTNTAQAEQQFYDLLSSTTIILDATGIHGVSRWVNEMSHDLYIPAVYASVTNGAWGGEIVRVIPGKTPCWLCWNEQYANAQPPTEPSNGFFAPGCNQPSFTGTTYDSAIVASLASSLIIDTILPQSPARPSFGGDYIRWSARDATGTPILKSEVLAVSHRPDCEYCNKK